MKLVLLFIAAILIAKSTGEPIISFEKSSLTICVLFKAVTRYNPAMVEMALRKIFSEFEDKGLSSKEDRIKLFEKLAENRMIDQETCDSLVQMIHLEL